MLTQSNVTTTLLSPTTFVLPNNVKKIKLWNQLQWVKALKTYNAATPIVHVLIAIAVQPVFVQIASKLFMQQ